MGGARAGFRAPPDFQLSNLNPKNIPAMNPKSLLACLFGITLAGIPAAHATLAITNGDFETGAPAGDSGDVLNWNDANPGRLLAGGMAQKRGRLAQWLGGDVLVRPCRQRTLPMAPARLATPTRRSARGTEPTR